MRKIPPAERVDTHPPGGKRMPEPSSSDRVVFGTHFLIGFKLPASLFLWQFLEFYGLEMQHLGPNSALYLACFSTLCEAHLGLWPCDLV
ncbi:hypothetical protein D1007_38892 [Hordeum vulgare]|nr:hypothetical protein D1007_38892 [Hordeum vulgare]